MNNVIRVNFRTSKREDKHSNFRYMTKTICISIVLFILGLSYLVGCFFLILKAIK